MEKEFFLPIKRVTFGFTPEKEDSLGYTVGSGVGSKFPNLKVAKIELEGENEETGPGINTIIKIYVTDISKTDNRIIAFRKFISLPCTVIYDMTTIK